MDSLFIIFSKRKMYHDIYNSTFLSFSKNEAYSKEEEELNGEQSIGE